MLFIGRTMNKETQLGRKGDKKKGQSTVLRILCGISRSSQNRFHVKCVQLRVFFPSLGLCLCPTPRPVLRKAPVRLGLVQMLWLFAPGCCSSCHGAVQLQRNMSHLNLPSFTRWLK